MTSSDLGTIAISPRQAATSAIRTPPERCQVRAFDRQLSLQHVHHIALMGNRQDEEPIAGGIHKQDLP